MDEIAATSASLPLGTPVRRRLGRRAVAVAALALTGLWLGLHEDVKQYKVTSGSMEPTLQIGQRVGAASGRQPEVGDIVVFHPPVGARPTDPVCGASGQGSGWPQPCDVPVAQESGAVFVKRVVAGPGDVIAIVDGHLIRNGVRQDEPYVQPCAAGAACSFPNPVRVPTGEYYLLGDNRGVSDDSRFWGPVPRAWIIGLVVRCSWLGTTCQPVR